MLFREFGSKNNPAIVMLHGGGLSWWSLCPVIEILREDYFIIAPVIDGHGEDGGTEFVSIEDSAKKLINYIVENFGGSVFALTGLSLGAQIVVEALSSKKDIAKYAVIESALVIPLKGASLLASANGLFYGLISKKWFSKLQAKALMIPDKMLERYYEDSLKISKQSLINITSSNGSYSLRSSITETSVKALIIAGEKELRIMKNSAALLHEKIPRSDLLIAPGMKHGEMSLRTPKRFAEILKEFFK